MRSIWASARIPGRFGAGSRPGSLLGGMGGNSGGAVRNSCFFFVDGPVTVLTVRYGTREDDLPVSFSATVDGTLDFVTTYDYDTLDRVVAGNRVGSAIGGAAGNETAANIAGTLGGIGGGIGGTSAAKAATGLSTPAQGCGNPNAVCFVAGTAVLVPAEDTVELAGGV